jgi:hypothetical protein
MRFNLHLLKTLIFWHVFPPWHLTWQSHHYWHFFFVPPIAPKTIFWASQDQPMSFLKCFPMALNTFHVPYIFLGTPNILQNHIQHPQHPLVPPPNCHTHTHAFFKCAFSIAFGIAYSHFTIHPWCCPSVYVLLTKLKLSLNRNAPPI